MQGRKGWAERQGIRGPGIRPRSCCLDLSLWRNPELRGSWSSPGAGRGGLGWETPGRPGARPLILDASGVWLTPPAKQSPLLLEASPSPTPWQSQCRALWPPGSGLKAVREGRWGGGGVDPKARTRWGSRGLNYARAASLSPSRRTKAPGFGVGSGSAAGPPPNLCGGPGRSSPSALLHCTPQPAAARCLEAVPGDHGCLFLEPFPRRTASGRCPLPSGASAPQPFCAECAPAPGPAPQQGCPRAWAGPEGRGGVSRDLELGAGALGGFSCVAGAGGRTGWETEHWGGPGSGC